MANFNPADRVNSNVNRQLRVAADSNANVIDDFSYSAKVQYGTFFKTRRGMSGSVIFDVLRMHGILSIANSDSAFLSRRSDRMEYRLFPLTGERYKVDNREADPFERITNPPQTKGLKSFVYPSIAAYYGPGHPEFSDLYLAHQENGYRELIDMEIEEVSIALGTKMDHDLMDKLLETQEYYTIDKNRKYIPEGYLIPNIIPHGMKSVSVQKFKKIGILSANQRRVYPTAASPLAIFPPELADALITKVLPNYSKGTYKMEPGYGSMEMAMYNRLVNTYGDRFKSSYYYDKNTLLGAGLAILVMANEERQYDPLKPDQDLLYNAFFDHPTLKREEIINGDTYEIITIPVLFPQSKGFVGYRPAPDTSGYVSSPAVNLTSKAMMNPANPMMHTHFSMSAIGEDLKRNGHYKIDAMMATGMATTNPDGIFGVECIMKKNGEFVYDLDAFLDLIAYPVNIVSMSALQSVTPVITEKAALKAMKSDFVGVTEKNATSKNVLKQKAKEMGITAQEMKGKNNSEIMAIINAKNASLINKRKNSAMNDEAMKLKAAAMEKAIAEAENEVKDEKTINNL